MALGDQNAARTSAPPTTTVIATPANAPVRTQHRWGRWIASALLLLLLVVLVYVGVFLARPAWQGYQAAQTVRTLVADGLTGDDAPALEEAIVRADDAYGAVVRGMRPINPLLRLLGFLPRWGGTLAAAPELMEIGLEASAMAVEIAPVLQPALAADGMLARASALADALGTDQARVERLAQHAEQISLLVPQLPVENLEPRIAGLLQQVEPLLPLLPDMMRALPDVPTLLGNDAPRTYLLLVQNNHELRSTGGFITAVGRVTLDKGEIVELDFADSYDIFRLNTAHPPPPEPMQEYMGIPYLVFRDANWSPDLPTSSSVAHALYTLDSNLDYSDTITVDLFAVERLIDALAPLEIAGVDTPITGANILDVVKEMWARPPDSEGDVAESVKSWWGDRKNFIPLVAQAALAKVMVGDVDYGKMATAVLTALDNREIQMVTTAPAVQELLADKGWDGAMAPPEQGDFVALVDTNFGYNKANAAIAREMRYVVVAASAPDVPATATLTITYTHQIDGDDPGCDQTPRYGTSYDDMVARCFFNYVRVYTPADSKLVAMTGVFDESIQSQRSEKNTQQFAGYFILPPGESNTVTITWQLAPEVNQLLLDGGYSLRVQRQSGSGALPLAVEVGDAVYSTTLEAGRLDWSPAMQADATAASTQ